MDKIVNIAWDIRTLRQLKLLGWNIKHVYGIKYESGYKVNGKKEGLWLRNGIYYKKEVSTAIGDGFRAITWHDPKPYTKCNLNYRNGKLNGLCTTFTEMGEIVTCGVFYYGTIRSVRKYNGIK